MKFNFLKRKKFWKRFFLTIFVVPVLLFTILITIVYFKQDAIVKNLIKTANEDFVGTVRIKDSHIAPFSNFPYISIDLENLEVFEKKSTNIKERIVFVKDTYVGFNAFELLSGKMNIKSIKFKDGKLRIVQHKDGTLNLTNAFESKKPAEEVKEDFHLDLKSIKLDNIDISKLNEENNMLVDAFINKAKAKFNVVDDHTNIGLDTKFKLSFIQNGDTTFIKNKNFELETEIDFNEKTEILTFSPTEISLEKANFGFEGNINMKDDFNIDLKFSGDKPDFKLFMAMAPEELLPTLEKFDNKGKIFFDARVKGKSINGHQPAINAKFGCENGYFNNTESNKKLDEIGFKGSFTNGEKRNTSTMKFELENFSAKPEAGIFSGRIKVENFDSPDIDMKLVSDFDLEFLSKFVNATELKGLSGKIKLTMNFRDIIDIDNPEKSIEKLNESYFSELEIKNLNFKSSDFYLPIKNLNMKATLKGHEAQIEKFNVNAGKTDLSISGHVSDLPAIIHHTNQEVTTDLLIKSKFIDIHELTLDPKTKKGVDEQIENLNLKLKFKSSAKAMTESPSLPIGEFFIEDLYAKMKHYPHTLHDFHADIFVESENFKIIDFSGMIDKSDFHFSGKLSNYNMWFQEKLHGDTKLEFDLTSKLLQFDNLFSYGGENYVPEDYRHEEIKNFKLHGKTDLHFNNGLKSTDFYLTQLDGKMKIHPMKFENFNGRVHLEDEQLKVESLKGKIGHSIFNLSMDYNLGKNPNKIKNKISLSAPRLDFDELMNYNEHPNASKNTKVDHDAVFSIYDFEFPDLALHLDIQKLNYHKYLLNHFKTDLRTETNHMLHVDKLQFDAAGGHFDISGYLSGKDKKHIYFNPNIKIKNLDLDKFMVKFDNFGQDYLVSDNLHGKFSGTITGKIHLHADLVPKIDDSEIIIDMTVLNGKLENYGPILAMSEYFQDKNLSKVKFDTLSNKLTLKKSVLDIPKMTINSTLGFMEITGKQKIDGNMDMDYLIGVPWKMIGQVASQKLFKRRKKESENTEEDEEIQYRQKNSKFVYIRMVGDMNDFKVSLAKKEK
jgi:hypothetical protein